MNLKKLFLAAALSVSLASCNGGGTPSKNQLFHDISDFLETRSVTIDNIPYVDSAADSAVVYSDSFAGDDDYAPCFYFVIEGNVVEESLAALKAGEWTVPATASEYGYECVNKQHSVEIDISYVETANEQSGEYAGTNYYVYAFKDLYPDYEEGGEGGNSGNVTSDIVVDNIIAFLKTRGVTVTSIPYFGEIKLTDVVYYEVEDGTSGEYYPCFYVILDGDVVTEALRAFAAAGWTVPTTAGEYGYECFNKEETVEIDIDYLDPTDPENEGVGGTSFCVYSYADLNGEGGDDDWDIDWTEPDAAVALAIATNIYGADAAEENVGWLLFYYVLNTIDGNDLEAAITVAARYLPNGFTLAGAVEVETESDEETGESYDVAYGAYANADGIVVEIDAYLSEEAGKIDVMYLIYLEDEDVFDDEFDFSIFVDAKEGKTDATASSNVVNNNDGSKTVTLDFTTMANQATFCKQTVGDLTVKALMGENKSNKPSYLTTTKPGCVNSLRIYWGTALEFSVPQGHEIVKIEFDSVRSKEGSTEYVDRNNLAIDNGTYTVSNNHVTITADENVNSLIMAINFADNGGHIALANISVTYK